MSVVVPTRGRPELVARAVRSALAQSYAPIEVIVVIDGRDPDTEQTLARLDAEPLRVVVLPHASGGAAARNAGVRAARGAWVAFLDDDDEWLPAKLEKQMRVARSASERWPIVCTRVIARSPTGDYTWPRRIPAAGEPMSEYLFARRGLFQGEGLVQSSMILAPRELMEQVPFDEELRGHQDWDWAIRAAARPGTVFRFVPEAMAIWYVEERRSSVSRSDAWEESLAWIERIHQHVTPRAYAAFLATTVSARASQAGARRVAPGILRRMLGKGRPSMMDLLVFGGIWLVPQEVRRWLRGALSRGSTG